MKKNTLKLILGAFVIIYSFYISNINAETHQECLDYCNSQGSSDAQTSCKVHRCGESNAATNIEESQGKWSDSEFWTSASNWFSGVKKNGDKNAASSAKGIIDELMGYIEILGTTVIVIATMVLGVKYIFGSVDSKADVKENMITLLVACVFFFGWNALYNTFIGDGNLFFIKDSFKSSVGTVYSILRIILNLLAFAGVIYVGVKYIFAGASGRADLKAKSVYFIIGIIMVFSTINLLSYISKVINQVI